MGNGEGTGAGQGGTRVRSYHGRPSRVSATTPGCFGRVTKLPEFLPPGRGDDSGTRAAPRLVRSPPRFAHRRVVVEPRGGESACPRAEQASCTRVERGLRDMHAEE